MTKLAIVVGAGASCGYRLPTGAQLKGEIATALDVRYELGGLRPVTGTDLDMAEAVRHAARIDKVPPLTYQRACWRIRDAMPQAMSIDNFIDCHKDAAIERMGKLAIAHCILKAERNSTLFSDPRKGKPYFEFSTLKDDWLGAFFQILTQNCGPKQVEERLQSITFVIFNYDRCIEHYLWAAIQNYYGSSSDEAARILNQASFYHPYGTVGALPWQEGETSTEFGADISPDHLLAISEQLKTFTEGTDEDSSEIDQIRLGVRSSERLLFLGFAYHRLNMELLKSKEARQQDAVRRLCIGTAFGVSEFDTKLIRDEVRRLQGTGQESVHLRADLKCHEIFAAYSRAFD